MLCPSGLGWTGLGRADGLGVTRICAMLARVCRAGQSVKATRAPLIGSRHASRRTAAVLNRRTNKCAFKPSVELYDKTAQFVTCQRGTSSRCAFGLCASYSRQDGGICFVRPVWGWTGLGRADTVIYCEMKLS